MRRFPPALRAMEKGMTRGDAVPQRRGRIGAGLWAHVLVLTHILECFAYSSLPSLSLSSGPCPLSGIRHTDESETWLLTIHPRGDFDVETLFYLRATCSREDCKNNALCDDDAVFVREFRVEPKCIIELTRFKSRGKKIPLRHRVQAKEQQAALEQVDEALYPAAEGIDFEGMRWEERKWEHAHRQVRPGAHGRVRIQVGAFQGDRGWPLEGREARGARNRKR